MKVVTLPLVIAGFLSLTGLASYAASTTTHTDVMRMQTSVLVADAHEVWTRGKVVRVSAARGKVTIEHERIKNLDMMGMTMPFTVEVATLLDGLEVGDIIEFVAAMNGDELILKNLRKPAS